MVTVILLNNFVKTVQADQTRSPCMSYLRQPKPKCFVLYKIVVVLIYSLHLIYPHRNTELCFSYISRFPLFLWFIAWTANGRQQNRGRKNPECFSLCVSHGICSTSYVPAWTQLQLGSLRCGRSSQHMSLISECQACHFLFSRRCVWLLGFSIA